MAEPCRRSRRCGRRIAADETIALSLGESRRRNLDLPPEGATACVEGAGSGLRIEGEVGDPRTHQPADPGSPLKGPTTSGVIQPA